MLPIAALIPTDDGGPQFAGLNLAERAALVAGRAGIRHVAFTGTSQPDFARLARLRARGVFGSNLLGWPRLFAGLPAAERFVVLDPRTVIEPAALAVVLRDAAAAPESAVLAVDSGPDGHAMSLGIAVIPAALVPMVATVWSLQDAVNRLAETGRLRTVAVPAQSCTPLGAEASAHDIERAFRRHASGSGAWGLAGRLARVPAVVREWIGGPAYLAQQAARS